MKYIILLLSLFFYISTTAQFRIVSSDEFEIEVPQNIKSYSIFCHSTSIGWKEVYKGERVLLKTALVTNGQETRVTEFFKNKIARIRYNYFHEGLLQKAVVKYNRPKSKEIFYYKYDTLSKEPIDVKGYKDGELIYTETRKVNLDTVEVNKNYIDVNGYTGKERIVTFYSKDKLTKNEVVYRTNNPDTNYSFKKYNKINQIIEDVDSASDHYIKTTYQYDTAGKLIRETSLIDNEDWVNSYIYDTNGRLNEEIVSRNSIEKHRISYDSFIRETITTKYQNLENQKKDTISLSIERFDLQGNLIFKEKISYENNIYGVEKKPIYNLLCYWIYEDNKVVKYIYRRSNDGPIITYDITYEE